PGLAALHDLDAGELDPTALEGAAPACARVHERAAAAGTEEVLFELDPELVQCIGRVVRVGDHLGAADPVGFGLERDLDPVIGALLPVVGPRLAGSGPDRGWRRERERRENLLIRGRERRCGGLGADAARREGEERARERYGAQASVV